ncbi:MAG: hypothetical protein AAGC71_04970 [Pseudomonadota bacterium]
MNFFEELRRRNVYRVATAYIVVGWLIMQVVDVLVPALQMPDWVASLFAVVLMLGFPIVLVLSWIYDVTPDGVVRTDAMSATAAPSSSRWLDVVIVAGLLSVGSLVVWQQLERRGAVTDRTVAANAAIAVLPFNDLSPGGTFQYFADGVAEQILNTLMSQSELTVKGRTSSFSFRDTGVTIAELGERLDVGSVLEGSVRKFEDRVRIDARLVRAEDGVTLWGDSYESELGDIFALQDRIAEQVLRSLRGRLAGESISIDRSSSTDVDAYAAYLEASALIRRRLPRALYKAREVLTRAVDQSPDYAPLYSALALTERLLSFAPGGVGPEDPAENVPRAIGYADQALALDPNLPDALAVRGLLYSDSDELLLAERSLRRALELNPGHADARLWLVLNHFANRRYRDGFDELQELFAFDPLFRPATYNFVNAAFDTGQIDTAFDVVASVKLLSAANFDVAGLEAIVNSRTGKVAVAIQSAQAVLSGRESRQTSVSAALALDSLRIGAIDSALASGMPFVATRLALLQGENDEAVARADAWRGEMGEVYFARAEWIKTLAGAGYDETLLSYFDTSFGTLEAYERELFWPFEAEVPPFYAIAYAAHREGRQAFKAEILERWRRTLDVGRANGANNYNYDISEARWYALSGDSDRAMDYMDKAGQLTDGLLSLEVDRDFFVSLLDDSERLTELLAKNRARINEERTLLGLAPL